MEEPAGTARKGVFHLSNSKGRIWIHITCQYPGPHETDVYPHHCQTAEKRAEKGAVRIKALSCTFKKIDQFRNRTGCAKN
jgi:hypothetical protein